jgi:hypothetical protein
MARYGWKSYVLEHQGKSDISHGNGQIAKGKGNNLAKKSNEGCQHADLGFVNVVVTLIRRKSEKPWFTSRFDTTVGLVFSPCRPAIVVETSKLMPVS